MKKKRGFTLLELLVVISIIGILMAMGAVAYSNAQKKGRDARRIGDMKAVQNALEQSMAASNGVGYSSIGTTCPSSVSVGTDTFNFPVDPKTGSTYTCNGGTSAYCVCAGLEGAGGNSNAAADASCSGIGSGNTYFCVKYLQ